MPQDLPTAAELVEAAEREVTALRREGSADPARLALVAHVLRIVARELRDGPAADAAEHARLVELLGSGNDVGDGTDLRTELARRVRAGTVDPDDPALLAHLRATATDAVAIASPKHAASRRPR